MRHLIATRLVAVALTASTAVLVPAAAHAETVTVDDSAGDAKAFNFAAELGDGAEGQPLYFDAPAETSVDITRTVVTHGKRVTVSMYFSDLADLTEHSVDMRIFTPGGRYSLQVSGSADGPASTHLYPDGRRAETAMIFPLCRSLRARYDVAAGLVTVSFPATCVGAPRWIQVAAVASRLDVTPLGDGSVNLAGFGDDAFRGGLSENSRGRSPKVRRG
jgi:hypothetical protein